jgi:hypothetical protein
MNTLDRRTFLSGLAGSVLAAPAVSAPSPQQTLPAPAAPDACWLDVAAPFVALDPAQQLKTELLLTATCFPGAEGFRETHYGTDYQILLWDHTGKEIHLDNSGRLDIPAMRPTLLDIGQLSGRDSFFGGAKIRVAPSPGQVARAGDLFSAGFVRWDLPGNFDNVHAHPAAPQQAIGRFNYSMPFPALSEYHCAFSIFNPGDDESEGLIRVVDRLGRTAAQRRYRLRPHQTMLFAMDGLKQFETPAEAFAVSSLDKAPLAEPKLSNGGAIVIRNDSERVPFAYTFMKGREGGSFTVEHPLHFQADTPVKPARATPFVGEKKSFPAQALVYTPMLLKGVRIGDVQLESRFYLHASRWAEEALWMMPFVTTGDGRIAWVSNRDDGFAQRIAPAAVADQGVVRLTEFQSCMIDSRSLPLPDGYSGGFGAAAVPRTSHSLNKIELRAVNWGRVAMTHFRPGGTVAKAYRAVDQRGGLASDYIVSGAHVIGGAQNRKRNCLIAVMNIEFEDERTDSPLLQVFGPRGLVGEKKLGDFAPLACRHLLLSDLFPELESDAAHPFTLRMQAPNAMMIVSALHIDFERRDIALEHGSDRHSTFQDFKC